MRLACPFPCSSGISPIKHDGAYWTLSSGGKPLCREHCRWLNDQLSGGVHLSAHPLRLVAVRHWCLGASAVCANPKCTELAG